jgi:hypothetical protein
MLVLATARDSVATIEKYSGKASLILRADVASAEAAVETAEKEFSRHWETSHSRTAAE